MSSSSSSESKRSRDSTSSTTDAAVINVAQIFDAANENFIKLANEYAKVQPEYVQAVSNLQQEYIEAVRNAIQTTLSVQKQIAHSNTKLDSPVIPEAATSYVQGLVKRSNDFTDNLIRITEINNQLRINAVNMLRENVKNYSRTVEAAAEYNSNLAKAWTSSYQSFQQQFTSSRQ
jgi:hypothetical protein